MQIQLKRINTAQKKLAVNKYKAELDCVQCIR